MEQQKRKFGKRWWITATVALLMAVLFAVQMPLVAFAETENGGKGKYIKEMIMITAANSADAATKVANINNDEIKAAQEAEEANKSLPEDQKLTVPVPKTYYLFDKPIYSHDGFETFIAYTTTNNINNSVKAIKPMYMDGGWSYEDYNAYLDELADEANFLAKDLYKAICEYATHLNAGKDNALYAKKILSLLYEDDSEMNLSDFFVYLADKGSYKYDEDHYAIVQPEMITFMMQANKDILATIECALMIACKDSYISGGEKDTSFLTGMQTNEFYRSVNGYYNNPRYSGLDVYVQDLLISLPDVQRDVNYYSNSTIKLEGAVAEMSKRVQEEVLSYDPETTDEYLELEEEVINDFIEGGSEEEIQAAKGLKAFNTYFNNLSLENQRSYNNGKMFHDALKSCKYTGYDGKEYTDLLGLFMKYQGTTEEIGEQYKKYDFYPFLDQLSDGQLALLKVGLPQFLSTYLVPVELMNTVYEEMLIKLNKSAETEADIIKGDEQVSVYKDVDRSLYIKNNGVALTSEAITATKSKPLAHIIPDGQRKSDIICTVLASVAGGVAATSIITMAGMTCHLQNTVTDALDIALNKAVKTPRFVFKNSLGEIVQKSAINSKSTFLGARFDTSVVLNSNNEVVSAYAQLGFDNEFTILAKEGVKDIRVAFTECLGEALKMGFGIALEWIMGISIAIMIISIIIMYVYPLIVPEKDTPYVDIPRVMCSYEEVFGQPKVGGNPVRDYIYYYGLKNPLLTEEDDKRANTRNGKLEIYLDENGVEKRDTDILRFGDSVQIETTDAEGKKETKTVKRGGIGDVANWTLKGQSRQWVAVYYTTDSKAGMPVLAESLTVLSNPMEFSSNAGLIPVKQFHHNEIFDFNQAYAACKNENLQGVYLGYKCDKNAGTATPTATTPTQTASVFSDISLWGGVIAGLILGGGIGTLVTYSVIRKRKKKNNA